METANHEYYVSPELAKLLRQLGFDWECREYYYNFTTTGWSLSFDDNFVNWNSWSEQYISAPTLDVAQRWLREVKNMSVEILFEKPGKWSCGVILDTNKGVSFENFWREEFDYDIYEQAQEAGIKKALEMILKKGE